MLGNNFHKYLVQRAGMSEDELGLLPRLPQSFKYKKGDFLTRPEEYCYKTLFVERRLLKQYIIGGEGKEHILHFAPENWILNDRSDVYFKSTGYFIEALEDTEVYIMNEDFIQSASEISPSYRNHTHHSLHDHICAMQKRVAQLLADSAEKRYLEFVTNYPTIYRRVPQKMIASYLGITPEGLSRIRKVLSRKPKK